MKLVTLQEAKDHLRMDTDEMDPDLELKLEAVSELVLMYVKADPLLYQDSAGEPLGVPFRWKAATLVWLGILFKQRDGVSDEGLQPGEIPRTVSNLLWQDRKPTVA